MPGGDLLSRAKCSLSLALIRFTVLFEMGRGGSERLLPPSEGGGLLVLRSTDRIWRRVRGFLGHSVVYRLYLYVIAAYCVFYLERRSINLIQGYRVKPHGQLVLVSLTHYCASTPSLSTSWSRTTLQGAQGPGKTHLETSFPLRCFQRLSLPHLATRRCHWRDNRYTRGASTPVLSY